MTSWDDAAKVILSANKRKEQFDFYEWIYLSLTFGSSYFLTPKTQDEAFLAHQATHGGDKKNLLLPLLSARAGLCFGAEKQGLLPCCLGMRGIYGIYLPNMGLLGGCLTQNKKNGWSSALPVEENGLNFISYKPASLTPDSAPACRFWTFPYESPPFHSCFKLWHEVV